LSSAGLAPRWSLLSTKDIGALVVDIGGRTTDILYADSAVRQSVAGVGGDHITNIPMDCIPMPGGEIEDRRELHLGNSLENDSLKDDSVLPGREIERETLFTIVHLRLRLSTPQTQLDENHS
jgi:hypothetical protein